MLDAAARQWLKTRFGDGVRFDEPMSRHTSLGVGGPAEALVCPGTREDVLALMSGARERKIPYLVVGDGTNLVVWDEGVPGIVMTLSEGLKRLEKSGERKGMVQVTVEAGVHTKTLCRFCLSEGLGGMNFALGIPGTIGGAIRMNAGTGMGWMSDRLRCIEVADAMDSPRMVQRDELSRGYRRLSWKQPADADTRFPPVILGGVFELTPVPPRKLKEEAQRILKKRAAGQPMQRRSAGCFFKNPSPETPAGRLIEEAGLKGVRRGGAVVSDKHANFILNTGGATADDILGLMQTVRETVLNKFGILMEPEVQIVGKEKSAQK